MADVPDMGELMEIEDPNFGQVLVCVFGIRSHESQTYLALLDNPGGTVAELAETLDHNHNNVNRSLMTLLDKGLTERKHRLFDPGGYVYQYTAAPLPEAKEMMHAALDKWAEDVHACIDALGESQAHDRLCPR